MYKVAIYLLAPLFYLDITPFVAGLTLTAMVLGGFTWEFALGRTLWMPTRILPWLLFSSYSIYLILSYHIQQAPLNLAVVIANLLLFLALSGEVIKDRGRAATLVVIGVIALAVGSLLRSFLDWTALVSQPVIIFAAATRLFFPPAVHLVHTSLDYPFARLEILSFGMKRIMAMGIRSNRGNPLTLINH